MAGTWRRGSTRVMAAALGLAGTLGCSPSAPPATAPKPMSEREVERQPAQVQTALRYQGEIRSLVESRCTPCHFPGGYMFSVVPFNSYQNIQKRAPLVKLQVFTNKTMPFQQPMADEERSMIAEWIDAGLPE